MYIHMSVLLPTGCVLPYTHFQGPPRVGAGLVAPSTSSHPPLPLSSSTLPTTAPYQQPMQLEGVQPVHHHWFYLRHEERYWIPFSLVDSKQLEDAFIMSGHNISQEVRGGSMIPHGKVDTSSYPHFKLTLSHMNTHCASMYMPKQSMDSIFLKAGLLSHPVQWERPGIVCVVE